MISRRRLLRAAPSTAALSLLGLPRPALASALDRRFVFVFAYGGWDPAHVFAPEFDHPTLELPAGAGLGEIGGLRFVTDAARPDVQGFFEEHAERSVILNGLLVPSVAHNECLRLSLTGAHDRGRSDWGAILGSARGELPLPQVVIDGPSFPGGLAQDVIQAHRGEIMAGLVDGGVLAESDLEVGGFSAELRALVDGAVAERAAGAARWSGAQPQQLGAASEAVQERLAWLREDAGAIGWDRTGDYDAQVDLAADLLASGAARVVTLNPRDSWWDTHEDNDLHQGINFNALFRGLRRLMDALAAAPGSSGGALIDETVVVVLSEMGRSPRYNWRAGRDHWPYTSALLVGPGLDGGRVIGGWDEGFYGRGIDPASAELDDDGIALDSEVLGATLLQLGGVDPSLWLPGVSSLEGILL